MAKRWMDPMFIIPWFSSDGVRQRSVFHFKGDVDQRRVRRMIRRSFEKGMQITPQKDYLNHYIGKAGWTQVNVSEQQILSKSDLPSSIVNAMKVVSPDALSVV